MKDPTPWALPRALKPRGITIRIEGKYAQEVVPHDDHVGQVVQMRQA